MTVSRQNGVLPTATRLALLASALGTGMVYLDQGAVAVALPAIGADLGLGVGGLQWIISIYILFASAPLLVCGVLGDRFGRVRFYLAGMTLFGVGALSCAVAGDLVMLLVARAVQGLGSAMMVAVGLAMLNANTPPAMRGQVIGLWASLTSVVVSIGPVAGGVITELAGWRLVFAIHVPLAAAAMLLARRLHEAPSSRSPGPVDLVSVLLLLLGMGAVLLGLIEGPRRPGIGLPLCAALVGGGALAAFVLRQRTASVPLLPGHLFRHRVFAGINLVTALQWIAISAVFFFLPINLQQVQGYPPSEAGLAMLPISLSVLLLSRLAGRLADRFGALPPMLAGIGLLGAALALLAGSGRMDRYAVDLLPATLLFGGGLGLLIAPLTKVAMNALPDQHAGLASGVNNSATRFSNMIAVAALGALLVSLFAADLAGQPALLALAEAERAAVLASAGSLGALSPPPGLDADTVAALRAAVEQSFFHGWRWVMGVGTAICALSALVAWRWLRPG